MGSPAAVDTLYYCKRLTPQVEYTYRSTVVEDLLEAVGLPSPCVGSAVSRRASFVGTDSWVSSGNVVPTAFPYEATHAQLYTMAQLFKFHNDNLHNMSDPIDGPAAEGSSLYQSQLDSGRKFMREQLALAWYFPSAVPLINHPPGAAALAGFVMTPSAGVGTPFTIKDVRQLVAQGIPAISNATQVVLACNQRVFATFADAAAATGDPLVYREHPRLGMSAFFGPNVIAIDPVPSDLDGNDSVWAFLPARSTGPEQRGGLMRLYSQSMGDGVQISATAPAPGSEDSSVVTATCHAGFHDTSGGFACAWLHGILPS